MITGIKTGLLPLLAAVCALPLMAGPIYTVTLDTTPLPTGNYYLDYQLAGTDSMLGLNTVTIGNLTLGGGSFLNQSFSGGGSGAFPNYSLTDTKVFNQDLIGFTRGSQVQFNLQYTNNYPGGNADTFSFAVEDSSFNPIVSSGLQASLAIKLNGGTAPIQTFAADAKFNSTTPVITTPGGTVPEPGTLSLSALAISGLALRVRRRSLRKLLKGRSVE